MQIKLEIKKQNYKYGGRRSKNIIAHTNCSLLKFFTQKQRIIAKNRKKPFIFEILRKVRQFFLFSNFKFSGSTFAILDPPSSILEI